MFTTNKTFISELRLKNNNRILHVCYIEKFIPDFIEFVNENFNTQHHKFLIFGDPAKYPSIKNYINVKFVGLSKFTQLKELMELIIEMHKANKIVLHGLFNIRILQTLFFFPWVLKKCYWVIWGGDLYAYQKQKDTWYSKKKEFYRSFVIKRLGHFITHMKGDYDLARKWYGAKGKWHECFMYPSNLYRDYQLKTKKDDTINIQVGNSADPSNNHTEILERLLPYKEQNIRIFTPLSYGDAEYAEELIKFGNANFGEKFIPLMNFMPVNEYLDFLSEIDIAIFNHKRQQAMGNSIVLSGLGKKVLMRNDVPQWKYLKDHGIKVFDNQVLDLNILPQEIADRNRKRVSALFSKDNLLFQLNLLFSEH